MTSRTRMHEKRDPRLSELAEQLNCLTVEELLDTAIEVVPPLVQGRYVSLYLTSQDGEQLDLHRVNHQRPVAETISFDEGGALLLEVFRRQEAILIHDVESYIAEQGMDLKLDRKSRYSSGSCMLVPIWAKLPDYAERQIIGALNIADKTDFTIFGKDELRFSAQIGELLGEAIIHTQIIQSKLGGHREELESELEQLKGTLEEQQAISHSLGEARKRVLQLLPEMPEFEGYNFSVRYHPLESIVGDFYDVFEVGEKRHALVMGDISGTGVEAALIMSMSKQVLTICGKAEPRPLDALALANQEVHTSFGGESTVAAFYGVLDLEMHQLTCIRAGHPAPLHYRPGGHPDGNTVRVLDMPGFPLGMLKDQAYVDKLTEEVIQLADGDQLLLYSAYAMAATSADGEPFGVERLSAALERHSSMPAEDVTLAISDEIRAHVGPQATVDWTLLVVQCDGLTAASAVEAVAESLAEIEDDDFLNDDTGLFYADQVEQAVDAVIGESIATAETETVEALPGSAIAEAVADAVAGAVAQAEPIPSARVTETFEAVGLEEAALAEEPGDPLADLLALLRDRSAAAPPDPMEVADKLAALAALQNEIAALEEVVAAGVRPVPGAAEEFDEQDLDSDEELELVHPPYEQLAEQLQDLELDENELEWLRDMRFDEALASLGSRLVTAEAGGDLEQIEKEIQRYVRVAWALGSTL